MTVAALIVVAAVVAYAALGIVLYRDILSGTHVLFFTCLLALFCFLVGLFVFYETGTGNVNYTGTHPWVVGIALIASIAAGILILIIAAAKGEKISFMDIFSLAPFVEILFYILTGGITICLFLSKLFSKAL